MQPHRWKPAQQVGKLQVIAEAVESRLVLVERLKKNKALIAEKTRAGSSEALLLRVNLIHISPLEMSEVLARNGQKKEKKKEREGARGRVRPPLSLQILSICHITFKQHEKLRERPCTILCEGCQTRCRSLVPTAQTQGLGAV